MEEIVIAILAKDKEYCLDFYLNCILNQTYDKKKIHLYIRTNDNKDNTQSILDNFVKTYHKEYASIYYDNSSITKELKKYDEHEWNSERFKILGKLRQESINYAIKLNAHYFVVDCDNFITSNTLESLYKNKRLNCIGPMLKLTKNHWYSNFHNKTCELGYYQDNDFYHSIWSQEIKGLIDVNTIHCTYFLNKEILKEVTYDDDSERYEYAILSHNFRKKGIPQYLDNTKFYGFLYLNDQIESSFKDYVKEYWNDEYKEMNKL
jgi:hypothetical protein